MKPLHPAYGLSTLGADFSEKLNANLKAMIAERPPLGFFRLSRQADPDAVEEAQGGGERRVFPGTYWGDLMIEAKRQREVVIPDVDACTAWCTVKQGMKAKPMKPIIPGARRRFVPASEKWAIIVPEEYARKRVQPYFEMDLAGEMEGVSLLEYLVTFGGIEPKIARAAAARYSRVRKGDPLRLDARDVTGLLAAAEGREVALAAEAEE